MAVVPVRVNDRDLHPHKAASSALLDARTVLTKSPWEFVSLWLKRQKQTQALFYWDQSRQFAKAAIGLPLESAPLLHYYSFMNAAKALLAAKGIPFIEWHGVKAGNLRGKAKRVTLANEGVTIATKGVVPALATYLGDSEPTRTYPLKDILFNLPFVHRTYCLTFRRQQDLFYALTDCGFVFDTAAGEAYLSANLSRDFAHKRYYKRLPPSFIPDPLRPDSQAVRSKAVASISGPTIRSAADLAKISVLNQQLRTDLQYIAGAQTLWYVKGVVAGPPRISRSPLTLTLAAMHRLSELCRYRPLELSAFLDGQYNWLISEFVLMSPEQYLDGIAAEITGHQFLLPNVRSAV